jgi:hypothetical protein
MTQAPRNTLRHLATAALVAALALGSGCSGDFFTDGKGAVGDIMDDASNPGPDVGIQLLGIEQVPVYVDADLDGDFIIFDFSNVDTPGVLSTLESGGYPLQGKVLGVGIDSESTTADADGVVLQFDAHGVTVNFDQLEYDTSTFIKIDVRFAAAS